MKKTLLFAVAVLLAACSDLSTQPRAHRALKDCAEFFAVDCGISPTIDSISPSSGSPAQYDMNGHLVSPAMPTFVCVYGKFLTGGSVFFNDQYQSTSSSGCGDLMFTAPVTPSGQYSVYVSTQYGTSNTVYFSRE